MPVRPGMPLAALVLAALAEGRTAFLHRALLQAGSSCTGLVNRGSHFSVEVAVGTPPQMFDVVADTGSNTLVVPSCLCKREGNCNKEDSCFIGTNHSSTFTVSKGPQGPQSLYLTFGSGTIAGVVVQDIVEVARRKTYMKDGLLLMTNHALDFGGPFEGILGLGLPVPEDPKRKPTRHWQSRHYSSGLDHLVNQLRKALQGQLPGQAEPSEAPAYAATALAGQQLFQERPPGFLEQANVSRFSMCFNYNADGVLRLGATTRGKAHGSIGTLHWGLGFSGVSVGHASANVSACQAQKKRATPCGAIPDSGTTLIMAPRDHVLNLFEDLCERWPRCVQNHTTMKQAAKAARQAAATVYGFNPFIIKAASKAEILQQLLLDCHAWMHETDGLKELPPIFLHVSGSNGTEQTLVLPPRAYVLEQEMQHTGHAAGLLDVDRSSGGKVCSAAFGVMDYITQANGPIWILGTPIFYEFSVGYDMSTTPPSVSFSPADSEPCVSCAKSAGLVAAESTGKPRFLPGPARLPTGLDLKQPL